ncbi:hypothetical protein [Streptomyces sp. CB02261]|nr:hypothetical protein [Streptomyces sp. CB02261]
MIDYALADDDIAEATNLNYWAYWAYWVGTMSMQQPNDTSMADRALAA